MAPIPRLAARWHLRYRGPDGDDPDRVHLVGPGDRGGLPRDPSRHDRPGARGRRRVHRLAHGGPALLFAGRHVPAERVARDGQPAVRRAPRWVRDGGGRRLPRPRGGGARAAARRAAPRRGRGLRNDVRRVPHHRRGAGRPRGDRGDPRRARRRGPRSGGPGLRERARHVHADERPRRDRGDQGRLRAARGAAPGQLDQVDDRSHDLGRRRDRAGNDGPRRPRPDRPADDQLPRGRPRVRPELRAERSADDPHPGGHLQLLRLRRPQRLPARARSRSMSAGERAAISVVIPVFNEAKSLGDLHDRLTQTLKQLGQSHEIIFVDDGRRRRSDARLRVHAPGLSALGRGPDARLRRRVAFHPGARQHLRDVGRRGAGRPRPAPAWQLPLRSPPPAQTELRSPDGILVAPDPGRQPHRDPRVHPGPRLRGHPRLGTSPGRSQGPGHVHALRDPLFPDRPPDPRLRADRGVRGTDLTAGAAASEVGDQRGDRESRACWDVFAYHTFGARALEALLAREEQVVAVVTHPDEPDEGDWFESVADIARVHRLPLFTPPSPNLPAIVETLRALAADVILSVWYRRLLGSDLLALPRVAALNLHGSLLPAYRGRAPVNWVLVNGERRTGVTLHHMAGEADAGDIVAQQAIDIESDDTAFTLYKRMVKIGVELLLDAYPGVLAGTAQRIPQDPARATVFPRRRPEDGRVEWTWPAARIANMIRAVTHPYPGTFVGDGTGRLFL